MASVATSRELHAPYLNALLSYLADDEEAELQQARELGSTALGKGIPAAEMSQLHHESVRRILCLLQSGSECRKFPDPKRCRAFYPVLRTINAADAVFAAGHFFAESIAPFDAHGRDLRRSVAALRYQNNNLQNEVHRFSQMVFDEGMQLLAAARMAMGGVTGEAEQWVRGPFLEVQRLLERVEAQLVECSDSFRPRILDDLGPRAAIQALCRRFSKDAGLQIHAELGMFLLPTDLGRVLYRAVLEALTNVERHARANWVRICAYQERSVICCLVEDDGVGFEVDSVFSAMEYRGSGLGSVFETLRAVGGTLSIDSEAGSGTQVRISIEHRSAEL